VIFETTDQFLIDYKQYLDELNGAKWIRCRERLPILLGWGTIQHNLFHQDTSDEQIIRMYRSRYSERECGVIDQVFLSAEAEKGRPLTVLMKLEEYQYYTKFTVSQVLKGCQTFLALPPEKPHALRYLRGIIRGEAERNPTVGQQQAAQITTPVEVPQRKRPTSKPSRTYELRKLRSEWVNSQLAFRQQQYISMSPEEQSSLISDLESQFDANQVSV